MEDSVNQRIKSVIEYYSLTQKKFAESIGVAQTTVSSFFKRGSKPSYDILESIKNAFPEISADWLLSGEGEMLREATPNNIGNITITGDNNSRIGHGNTYNYPAVIEVKESSVEVECPKCGEIIDVPSDVVLPLVPSHVAQEPDIDLEFFRKNCPQEMEEVDLRRVWGKNVFLMQVDTRAMEPEYREGTFLVLRKLPDLSYARTDGSPYVIDTMRPHTLFRYLSKERDGTYVLTAENDRRGPLYLCADDIQNIYDIVGSFRIGR